METKELKITIPKDHEIDWQESAKQEKIVFKKKDTKPRSWEEYCKNNASRQVWFIKQDSDIGPCYLAYSSINADRNTLPSEELAKAFLAMMQLMSLRQAWIGDWKPDGANVNQKKATIFCNRDYVFGISYSVDSYPRPLSFPTKEMALDFISCFGDLLKIAKPLI